MGEPVKGTVTSLSSVVPPEEAQKASIRVQETISERQKEVEQLQEFLNDNTNLINLIKKLPDQLHHDIMVPFGKAAFFPGRLIHTNEFLVLLGEGYFAERTSKQTIEILKRREKNLESQIETLKAVMQDLKAEASFFDNTAVEAAEGIVEIREDYIDEASNEDKTITTVSGDEEYARILSRMDELEKEELESEIAEEFEEDNEDNEANLNHLALSKNLQEHTKSQSTREGSRKDHSQHDFSKNFKPDGSQALTVSKDSDLSSNQKVTVSGGSNVPETIIDHNQVGKVQDASVPNYEVSAFPSNTTSKSTTAFTGSIVEHAHNIENNQKAQGSAPASKPVSRFKLQRK